MAMYRPLSVGGRRLHRRTAPPPSIHKVNAPHELRDDHVVGSLTWARGCTTRFAIYSRKNTKQHEGQIREWQFFSSCSFVCFVDSVSPSQTMSCARSHASQCKRS